MGVTPTAEVPVTMLDPHTEQGDNASQRDRVGSGVGADGCALLRRSEYMRQS